jgi:hypothetical protein
LPIYSFHEKGHREHKAFREQRKKTVSSVKSVDIFTTGVYNRCDALHCGLKINLDNKLVMLRSSEASRPLDNQRSLGLGEVSAIGSLRDSERSEE